MDANVSTLTAWSYGIACSGFAGLAAWVAVKRQGGGRGVLLACAVTATAVWAGLGWLFAAEGDGTLLPAVAVADVTRAALWYAFLISLIVGARENGNWADVRVIALTAIVLTAAALAVQILGFDAVYGWKTAALTSLAVAVLALVLVETLFRNVPADARWNVKPLCIGLAGVFAFDVYLYADEALFGRMNMNAFGVRGLVHAAAIPFIALTAARTGTWTWKVGVSRSIAFHSAALLACGLYLLLVAAAGYYVRTFGGAWGPPFQIALLFGALMLLGFLATSGSARSKLKVLVTKHFYPYRYDYREEWLRFTHALSSVDPNAQPGQRIIRGLANLVESPSGALWLRDPSGRSFSQAARWNMPLCDATEPVETGLPQFLQTSGWVVNIEEYRSVPGRYGEFVLPSWVSEIPSVWLIVPLSAENDLIGFVVLGSPRARLELDWEVNDLLKTAGRQAASFIGYTQATEALLEAQKFDAFNRMSAFVVHDLKNLIAQLSLMLKNADRHKHNAEFQQDMLMTVGHTVDRMKRMIMQLREGTTPVDTPGAVDITEVMLRIQRAKQEQHPRLELSGQERVLARGHADRIERVIGHLVQNAIDATAPEGKIAISLHRDGGSAVVEIVDNGSGMSPEFARERLFKPFQTTKEGGMGIGAYESYQYVRELGGDIQVDTAPGRGTTMRVLLPLEDSSIAATTDKAVA